MNKQSPHIIKTQSYHIRLEEEKGAYEFQNRVSNINDLRINTLLNKILDRFDTDNERISFSKIELDLGSISKDSFEQDLQYRIEEELVYFLEHNIHFSRKQQPAETGEKEPEAFAKLRFYLLNGYYNWNVVRAERPSEWLLEVLKQNSEPLRKKLLELGRKENIRNRFIYRFQDPELEKMTLFLDQTNGQVIVDFKENVVQHQAKKQLLNIPGNKFRNAVWEVILEYLFVETGSYQNKKAILKHLLEKIAARTGIVLSHFLQTFIESIRSLPLKLDAEAELFKILKEIEQENHGFSIRADENRKEDAVFEEKLRYFFTYGSFPIGFDVHIETYLSAFMKTKAAQVGVFFRNLIKSNPAVLETMLASLSQEILLELIHQIQLESLRKLQHLFITIFENRAESHYLSGDVLHLVKTKKAEILLQSYLLLENKNKQLLFNLLMTIKSVTKTDNREFLKLLNGIQQILPSGFFTELDQLRQFIVLPALEKPEDKQAVLKPSDGKHGAATKDKQDTTLMWEELPEVKQSEHDLQNLLLLWGDFATQTNDMNRQSDYLWKLLNEYANKSKIELKQVLIQAEDLIKVLFADTIPNSLLITEQLERKINGSFLTEIPQEWMTGIQEMTNYVRTLLKRSFDGIENAADFMQLVDLHAKRWNRNTSELLKILKHYSLQEKFPEKERMQLFFEALENRLFDQDSLPVLSGQAHMNVTESRHHQLRKIIYDLQNLMQSGIETQRFETRLSDLIISLSRQLNLSKLSIVQQLQNTLSWSMPEGNAQLEEHFKQSEIRMRQQVKSSRFTADLIHYYLSEKALPWWAANLTYEDLKRHSSLYISLFPKEVESLQKNVSTARMLFDLLDHQAQNRMIQNVWKNIPAKFRHFHQELEDLIIQKYGGVRVSFDQIVNRWHFQLWRKLASTKKIVDLVQFAEFYVQVMHKELGIESSELMQLITFQQSHPYFEREPVKKILQQVFVSKSNPESLRVLNSGNIERDIKISLSEILTKAQIKKPIREDELLLELKQLIDKDPETFHKQMLKDELRREMISVLSEKNREKLAFMGMVAEKRNELEQSLELLAQLKTYLTSTQAQKLMESFYELYFLKLATDKANTWKTKDWAWLIHQSLRKTFRQEKVRQLIAQLEESKKIPQAHAKTHKLLQTLKSFDTIKELPVKKAKELLPAETQKEEEQSSFGDEIFIQAAGLVILSPFIPRLFEMLGLMTNGQFHDETAREKAIYALHFAAFGNTDADEAALVLPKIICGLEVNTPIGIPEDILTPEQEVLIESLLTAVIEQWKALKKTSIAGLRETFLQREGKLVVGDNEYALQVKQVTFDILLDAIPWGINKLKLSWMPKILVVAWR